MLTLRRTLGALVVFAAVVLVAALVGLRPALSATFPFVTIADASGNQIKLTTAGAIYIAGAQSFGTVAGSGATTQVVSTKAGRFFGISVSVTGGGAIACYDNASAASGTVLGAAPNATLTQGTVYNGVPGGVPVANGITCSAPGAGTAVVVVPYN